MLKDILFTFLLAFFISTTIVFVIGLIKTRKQRKERKKKKSESVSVANNDGLNIEKGDTKQNGSITYPDN